MMKLLFTPVFRSLKFSMAVFFGILFFLNHAAIAQNSNYTEKQLTVSREKTNDIDEGTLRKQMKADGVADAVIDKLIAQRKEWIKANKNVFWTNAKSAQLPIGNASCGGMGVEGGGWGSWTGYQGDNSAGPSTNITWGGALAPPTPTTLFAITSGTGIDPNTPGPGAGNPTIPVVCPGFGNNSIVLNQSCTINYTCEQLTYPLTVTAADTNFIYAYAIVIQDGGHPVSEQPFVQFDIFDSHGVSIPCSHQRYTGSPGDPSYYTVSGNGCASNFTPDHYKPWTLVGINLSAYIGQTLNVVITNADCDQGGHFAYSYWDFLCGSSSLTAGCTGIQTSICGPVDPNIAYTYQWYHNGTAIPAPQGTQQCITVTAQPNDTFKVDVNQPSGCNFHMRYVPASIQPGFTSVVQCNNVTFTDNTTVSPASTTVTSWNWSFPGGTPATATTQTALVTYPAAGSYVATLTVTCSAGCFDVITHTVTVAGPPVAAFSNVPVCIGSPTPFTDNSTAQPGDPIATYSWSFPGGNPATSTAQNPTSTYPAGTYTATLTVTSQQGCTGVTSQTVAINPQPAAVFNGTNVCLNGSNVFTDHSVGNNTISNWNWSFDDGSTSNSQNPSHPFATYGTHTATLIVTNNFGCKDTTTKTVVVNPLPTANFSSTPVCFGACTPFTDLSTIPTGAITGWAWSFGDPASGANNTSAIQAPCHTFSASGPFNISLTVTSDSSCTNTVTLPATVIPLPVSAFSSTTVCVGNATSFTDNSVPGTGDPISSWSWSLTGGNPATSTLQNPNSTFPAGSYSATLTLTSQHGCTATVTQPLTVNPRPAASFTGTNVCLNNITTFTDQSVGNNSVSSWSWNFADPGSGTKDTSSFQNPTHTYASTGAFTTTLIITNNFGCKDTTTKTVIVNPLPVVNFSYVPVCYGDSTCFKDLSTISTGSIAGWNWNFGDLASGAANISNLKNPCHVFSGLGPYSVLLTVTSDSTCQSTTVLTATVIPHPVAAITPQNACLHFPAGFTDNSSSQGGDPITSWDWNFGDGTPDVGIQNPTHNYAAPGTYTTTLIVVSSKGCKDTVTKPVTIYNNPVAAFTTPKSGCSPVSQTFADVSTSQDGTIVSWLWDFQGGSPAIGATANSSSTWSNAGSYGVQLIVTTSFGCKDTLFIPNYINVYSWPNAGFTVAPAQNSVITPDFSFANLWSNDVTHWVWNFGDNTTDSTSLTPVHSYSATATNNDYYTYPICLYVQNIHGCWDSICHNVELEPEFEFYIPNSFTPNGDNINDVFYGKSRGVKDYNIWLFDRWGNLIWDCHWTGKNTDWDNRGQEGMSSSCKWDGIVEGGSSNQMAQQDVYVWKVKLTDVFDKVHNYIGSVTIVK